MKKRMILVVSLLMVFAFTAGVIANPAVESITANLAKDIKFVVDGESWAPAETDGSAMYPIIYKDRTYLPVRAIGEALGVKVDWNNDTRTVILGDAPAPVEEPVVEEPVVEEPVVEEPVVEEPVAELAINPVSIDLNKNAVNDIPIDITWGTATKINGITGVALGGVLNITLVEGTHYVVNGNVLTIKKELTELIPLPINQVPDDTVLTLTINFDQGAKTFDIKVVS
ncbi:MAG TPA: stalk domain-containing protein [Syntrophomonadaceae bacterium]|nr:stalk domain-containing protein [Syntrophomonadaceae bacterium]HRX20284.1 stalk domain-containing protein [Syntrophomonadaceae bacterium]